jgi:hypothetical protein
LEEALEDGARLVNLVSLAMVVDQTQPCFDVTARIFSNAVLKPADSVLRKAWLRERSWKWCGGS